MEEVERRTVKHVTSQFEPTKSVVKLMTPGGLRTKTFVRNDEPSLVTIGNLLGRFGHIAVTSPDASINGSRWW